MPGRQPPLPVTGADSHPFRVAFVVSETAIAVGGAAGALQLATGTYTPPVADLEPLGLTTWRLPGAWLFASVAVPSATAAWLAYRRSPHAPTAVLAASGLLGLELAVQVPFVGRNRLQAVFGVAAAALAGLAVASRRRGWPRS